MRRSYLDDRFELFGKEAILEYVDVLAGGPVWDTIRDRDKIEMVWVRPERGLAKRLLKDPGWSVVYRDKVSILFREGTANEAHGAVDVALSFSRTTLSTSSGNEIVYSLNWPGRIPTAVVPRTTIPMGGAPEWSPRRRTVPPALVPSFAGRFSAILLCEPR